MNEYAPMEPEPGVQFRAAGRWWLMRDAPAEDPALHRELDGVTVYSSATIVVDGSLPAARKCQVRFHELLHVADRESGGGKDWLTEAQTRRIASALWAILRDTYELQEWIGLPAGEPVHPVGR